MRWRENVIRGSASVSGKLTEALPGLLFPRRCPVCDDIVMPKGELCCPECRSLLSYVREPVCMKCGKEISDGTEEYCSDCRKHRRTFEYAISVFNYTDIASDSLSAIKYKNRREYLDFYAEEALRRRGERLLNIHADCMIPVPVHPARLRKRGFNQAALLAEKIGEKLNIPVEENFLRRNRNTAPQKVLGPAERLKNLQQAFTTDKEQIM